MAIADSTLSTDLWVDLKAKLVAASLTASNASSTDSASISAAFPDKPGSKPHIVINPPVVDEDGFPFGGSQGDKIINVVIEVVGSKTYMVQQLSDQVRDVLTDNDIDGVDLVRISEDYSFSMPGGNKWHLKTIVASYQRGA